MFKTWKKLQTRADENSRASKILCANIKYFKYTNFICYPTNTQNSLESLALFRGDNQRQP